MPRFSHQLVIQRPIEAVFDVATTAKHWPAWHPATTGVDGAIDHPVQLGEQIIERVNIGGRQGEGTWTVVDYARPYRLTLLANTSLGETKISYSLVETTEGVVFRRDLSYEIDAPPLEAIMEQQSAVAVVNLKGLLEREIPRHV